MFKWNFGWTKKNFTKSNCWLEKIMIIGKRLNSILHDEAFVVKRSHDTLFDLSHEQLMLLTLNLGHVLTNVPSWRQNIIEKIVVKGFFHASLDTFRPQFDPTFIFDAIDFGSKTSGFRHDLTIQFFFRCEWYFFVCRIEKFVILGIIRQIEQMLENLNFRVADSIRYNKEPVSFYTTLRPSPNLGFISLSWNL